MINSAEVGKRIEKVKRSEGLTQDEMANLFGVSRTSLQFYLKGERDLPISAIAVLFEKYSIDPVWLMYGDGSDGNLKRRKHVMEEIRSIGLALENRAIERDIDLDRENRWKLITQIYTVAALETYESNLSRVTSDHFLDTFLEQVSNGQ